ncbi:MAG: 3-isopropylmalate dehydratase small subunit [Clostridiales bacterium]|nr:3-isopropylmalate dehydratase small subunit [Clostridiales bacterium]
MKAQGLVHRYADNVDTDVIIPARYLNTASHAELAAHCMEDIDREFVSRVKDGDIMVAGKNFGCGSSREHAPIAIKASGISCVIAASFARIFYRNAINIGLAILECPQASADVQAGDELNVDFDSGVIHNLTTGRQYQAEPFPPFIQEIIQCGGLLNSLQKK